MVQKWSKNGPFWGSQPQIWGPETPDLGHLRGPDPEFGGPEDQLNERSSESEPSGGLEYPSLIYDKADLGYLGLFRDAPKGA